MSTPNKDIFQHSDIQDPRQRPAETSPANLDKSHDLPEELDKCSTLAGDKGDENIGSNSEARSLSGSKECQPMEKVDDSEKLHQDTEAQQPPPVLTRPGTNDRPYSIFTSRQKVLMVLVATLGGCFSPFTTNIYFPAISTISKDLSVSISKVNLTITTYMIFQGLAPSFISAIADVRGRRPAYVIGFVVYMLANLGLALNNSYAGLLVLRCLQSCGSSGLTTLQQGTIADVVTSGERGKYISITSLSGVLAPSLAPILGGVLAQYLGWHSIFWFLLIASGVYFIPLLLMFPETCRSIVGDGSIPPPKWNRCLLDVTRKRNSQPDAKERDAEQTISTPPVTKQKKPMNPLATLKIVADPESALILIFTALIYAGFYAISTSLTVQFHNIYGLDSTLQGLLFLPQAVGNILAALTNSRLLDANFRRHARKAGIPVDKGKQTLLKDMPLERARLEIATPAFALGGIFIIVYGWLLQVRVHIAGPIVILVCIGYTTLVGFNCLTVLIIDLHRKQASTAAAASNLVRCLLGAGASAVVNPVIEALTVGWTFTLVGGIYLLTLPLLVVVMRYGIQMRAKRRQKEEVKAQQGGKN